MASYTTLNQLVSTVVNIYKNKEGLAIFRAFHVNANDLAEALDDALSGKFYNFLQFLEDKDTLNKEIAKKNEELEDEMIAARKELERQLDIERSEFNHKIAMKELELDHREKAFIAESGYTRDYLETELANQRLEFEKKIELEKASFEQEMKTARDIFESTRENDRVIAEAELDKYIKEAQIRYEYDKDILQKQVASDAATRYEALITIAKELESAQDLITRLEEDKAYFQNLAEKRIESGDMVLDSIVELAGKDKTPVVNVNVPDCKKSKKSN